MLLDHAKSVGSTGAVLHKMPGNEIPAHKGKIAGGLHDARCDLAQRWAHSLPAADGADSDRRRRGAHGHRLLRDRRIDRHVGAAALDPRHDIEVRNADDAYTRLLTEVTGYFDQFSRSAAAAVSDETYLLGLSDEDSAARRQLTGSGGDFWRLTATSPRRAAGTARKAASGAARQARVVRHDLQRIAARNQSLSKQLVDTQSKADHLTADRDSVAAERDNLTHEVAVQHNTNQALTARVAQLTASTGQLDAQLQVEAGKQAALTAQLTDLQAQLDQVKFAISTSRARSRRTSARSQP